MINIFNLFKPKTKTVLARDKDKDEWFRFKVHKGNQIWLIWGSLPFPLELKEDGTTICKFKDIVGTNKPYPWVWMEDDGRECKNAEL